VKILIANYEFPPIGGGGGTASEQMARTMARLGHDVRILTGAYSGLRQTEQLDGYVIHRVPALRRDIHASTPFEMSTYMAGAAWTGLRLVQRWRPDACLAFFGIPGGPVALLLKKLFGIPYVVSLRGGDVHGFMGNTLEREHRLTAPLSRMVWRNAHNVVANCEHLQHLASTWLPDTPVSVIPNGIDIGRFTPVPSNNDGPVRLCFVGRLNKQKCVDVLLKACTRIDGDFTLSLIGDGPEHSRLESLCVSLNLSDRVSFCGWRNRDELPAIYGESDILVLPSMDEGMSNVLLEAQASGLPCIATQAGGNGEVVVHDKTGILVPPNDEARLAEAMNTLIRDPELRTDMGNRARTRMETDFSWESVTRSYLNLLETASNGGKA